MNATLVPVRPARWDVPAGERLGAMPLPPPEPGQLSVLTFSDELVACAARVLARSGGGPVYFVGRSCDSLHDALKVLLAGTGHADVPRLLPFSIDHMERLTTADLRQWRVNTAALGLTPAAIARAERQVALCDLVWAARTFTFFFHALRGWAEDEREPWNVIRRKLRYVGIVRQGKSSPKTWRWTQGAQWPGQLPHTQVGSIAVPVPLWHYLGDSQAKLTQSFRRERWADGDLARSRDRSEPTRRALAEAESWVEFARSAQCRQAFVRELARTREVREPWLRALIGELRGTDAGRAGRRHNASRLPSARR